MCIKKLSIYLHWPFCLSKCPYCDFMSIPTKNDGEFFEKYAELLLLDLKNSLEKIDYDFQIETIFFGGGTPSLMPTKAIEKTLKFLQKKTNTNAEISLEANPATFDSQKMIDLRNAGINRISLGIQSFSDINLQFLGRIYNSYQAHSSAEIIAKNFYNFSFDFIYGYECQNINSFEKDLRTAINFDCKHISCYELTFEENTLFHKKLLSGVIKPISEEKEIQFYEFTDEFLKQYGILHYEISNYAKKDFECKHNLAYWNYCDYLGVGPAAHGRIKLGNCKYATEKIRNPFNWAKAIEEENETYSLFSKLNEEEILQEILIMKLRLLKELDLCDLYKEVSKNTVEKIISHKKLQFLQSQRFIKVQNLKKIKLTKTGILKLNSIVEFLCS